MILLSVSLFSPKFDSDFFFTQLIVIAQVTSENILLLNIQKYGFKEILFDQPARTDFTQI